MMCVKVERGGFTRQVPKVETYLPFIQWVVRWWVLGWCARNLSFENQMNLSQER
jgi:hypothetical protein